MKWGREEKRDIENKRKKEKQKKSRVGEK